MHLHETSEQEMHVPGELWSQPNANVPRAHASHVIPSPQRQQPAGLVSTDAGDSHDSHIASVGAFASLQVASSTGANVHGTTVHDPSVDGAGLPGLHVISPPSNPSVHLCLQVLVASVPSQLLSGTAWMRLSGFKNGSVSSQFWVAATYCQGHTGT